MIVGCPYRCLGTPGRVGSHRLFGKGEMRRSGTALPSRSFEVPSEKPFADFRAEQGRHGRLCLPMPEPLFDTVGVS